MFRASISGLPSNGSSKLGMINITYSVCLLWSVIVVSCNLQSCVSWAEKEFVARTGVISFGACGILSAPMRNFIMKFGKQSEKKEK